MYKNTRIISVMIAACLNMTAFSAFADIVIIGHPEVDASSITTNSIRKIFLGERRSLSDGQHAVPINHTADSPDRKEFFNTVLSISEASHKRHWKRKQSTSMQYSPQEVSSHKELLQSIANTPGSIGYIDADKVNDKVKVLLTIEKFDDV